MAEMNAWSGDSLPCRASCSEPIVQAGKDGLRLRGVAISVYQMLAVERIRGTCAVEVNFHIFHRASRPGTTGQARKKKRFVS